LQVAEDLVLLDSHGELRFDGRGEASAVVGAAVQVHVVDGLVDLSSGDGQADAPHHRGDKHQGQKCNDAQPRGVHELALQARGAGSEKKSGREFNPKRPRGAPGNDQPSNFSFKLRKKPLWPSLKVSPPSAANSRRSSFCLEVSFFGTSTTIRTCWSP